jgi:two-component system, LytTR family, response regulator
MEHTFNNPIYWRQVKPQEIILLQADGNYTTLILKNGKKLLLSICLKKLELRLSNISEAKYLRISRSVLVNLDFITEANYKLGFSHVTLANKTEIPISRRKRIQIRSKMKEMNPKFTENYKELNPLSLSRIT